MTPTIEFSDPGEFWCFEPGEHKYTEECPAPPTPIPVQWNNTIEIIDSWGPFFRISLDLMIHSFKPTSTQSEHLENVDTQSLSSLLSFWTRTYLTGNVPAITLHNDNRVILFEFPVNVTKKDVFVYRPSEFGIELNKGSRQSRKTVFFNLEHFRTSYSYEGVVTSC